MAKYQGQDRKPAERVDHNFNFNVMNNFLKKVTMPLAVAVLGIGGAFTTTSMNSSKSLAHVVGYQFVSASNPCDEVKMCQTDNNGILCRVNDEVPTSPLLKGWPQGAATCSQTLYRI